MGFWDTLKDVANAAGKMIQLSQINPHLRQMLNSLPDVKSYEVIGVDNKGATVYLIAEIVDKSFLGETTKTKEMVLYINKNSEAKFVPKKDFNVNDQATVISCPNCNANYFNLTPDNYYTCENCGTIFYYSKNGYVTFQYQVLLAYLLGTYVKEHGGLNSERAKLLDTISKGIEEINFNKYFKAALYGDKKFNFYFDYFKTLNLDDEQKENLINMLSIFSLLNEDEKSAKKSIEKLGRQLHISMPKIGSIFENVKKTLLEEGYKIGGERSDIDFKIYKALIDEIIESYSDYESSTIFFKPDIPEDKISGAISEYAIGVKKDDVLLLIDDTFWGGAGDGILLTYDAIYSHEKFGDSKKMELKQINYMDVKQQTVIINDVTFFNGAIVGNKELKILEEIIEKIIDLFNEPQEKLLENYKLIKNKSINENEEKESEKESEKMEDDLGKKDVVEKLKKLKEMLELDLITKDEYERKKDEILKNL